MKIEIDRPEQSSSLSADAFKLGDRRRHHDSFQELCQTASHGCKICQLFLLQMCPSIRSQCETQMLGPGYVSLSRSYGPYAGTILRLRLTFHDTDREPTAEMPVVMDLQLGLATDEHDLEGLTSDGVKQSVVPNKRDISVASEVESWLTTLVKWFKICDNHHFCRPSEPTSGAPPAFRLVEIGYADDYTDVVLRDVNDLGSMDRNRYITISHRWSSEVESCKLLKQHVRERRQKIDVASLPLAFRDCIDVARNLQLHIGPLFLWIDSLCIIQDSEADWNAQAGVMDSIYQYAYCNFALCDSSSVSILPTMAPELAFPVPLEHPCDERYRIGNFYPFRSLVSSSALDGRGWVFQEIMLAPRVVYFSHQQILWACHCLHATQYNPTTDCSESSGVRSWRQERRIVGSAAIQSSEPGIDDPVRDWWALLRLYTSKHVTKPHDRLIALSGIAHRFSTSLSPSIQYVCGLWSDHLVLHLAWHASTPDSFYTCYCLPSWSWTAVRGPCSNAYPHDERVRDGVVQQVDSIIYQGGEAPKGNPFGNIHGAKLTVRGVLLKVIVETVSPYFGVLTWNRERLGRYFKDMNMDHKYPSGLKGVCYMLPLFDIPHDNRWALAGCEGLQDGNREPSDMDRILIGLVLVRPRHKAEKGLFRRLGVFELENEYSPLQKCLETHHSETLEKDEFLLNHHNGHYTIVIE